jgi:hypothetical protein
LADLDSKTIPLLAFGLAVAGFLQATTLHLDQNIRDGLTGVAALGLFATFAAMLPRDWGRVPNVETVVEDANRQPGKFKEGYLSNFLSASRWNEAVLKRKFRWFKLAVFAYLTVIGAVAGFILIGQWTR